MIKAETDKKTINVLLLVYTVITLVGIVAGQLLATQFVLFEGIALGFASGTLIYISCSEVVVEEFALSQNKWLKFCLFVAGAVFMKLIA